MCSHYITVAIYICFITESAVQFFRKSFNMSASNLGFIGGGNMSTAIFKGILNKDAHPASKVWVSGPNLGHIQHWQELGANITDNNGQLFSKCDLVFLGVKPGMLVDVVKSLSHLPDKIQKPKLVISMLAGVTLEQLKKVFKMYIVEHEMVKIVRIMPNVPVAISSGACLYSYGDGVGAEQKEFLVKLLKSCGDCEEIPEKLMDSLGVLTGCGPAYMFVVIEALADGAVKQGAPRDTALRFAAQMMMGSAHLVLESKKHPGQLKDEVCSPGGSTIAGVSVLEDGKIRSTLINAIEASTKKTKELLSKAADPTV